MATDPKNVNISYNPQQHKCFECGNTYKHFKHLKYHFKEKHPSKVFDVKKPVTKNKPYKCDKCESQFSKPYYLTYHKRKVHKEHHSHPHRTFQCSKCPCKYSKKRNLLLHVKNKHPGNNRTNQPQISRKGKCPICDCSMREGALFHFSSVHQINIDIQSLEFDLLEDFTAWKANIEKETIAKYVKKRGSFVMNTHVRHYYICHRTGNYKSQSKGHRLLKKQGSNKIGGICPASITVKENKTTGKCSVSFITTHIGHVNSLFHKEKISNKVSVLRKRHKASILIKDVNIIKDGNKWNLASTSTNEIYSIEEVKKDCTCKLHCQSCQSCIHRYKCTCIDSSIKWNMCKHIHLLCRFLKENDKIEPEHTAIEQVLDIVEENNITETQAVLETLSQNIGETSTLDEEKAQLKTSIMNLLNLSNSLTTIREVRILKRIVSSAKPTLMASRSNNLNKQHHSKF